jgi:hypothetical protein
MNWEYELKCRRCGVIKIVKSDPEFPLIEERAHEAITKLINEPNITNCTPCKKNTIQDVVSFNFIKE